MKNGFYLITGTSKGIGEAVAKVLLDRGNIVLGIARGHSDRLKSGNYYHLSYDLADTVHLNQIMEKVDEIVSAHSFDFICLLNNASASEPLGAIEKCPASEIESHIRIGLIVSMILTSMFIRRFINEKIRKKVVFISSGAAFQALPEDSVYNTTKAGLYMFSQCVALEQKDRVDGFEVISIRPGMVDTSMQLIARSKTSNEYAMADYCKQAYEKGELEDPNIVAQRISNILENIYELGSCINAWEVKP